jgi:hypothetical protein
LLQTLELMILHPQDEVSISPHLLLFSLLFKNDKGLL